MNSATETPADTLVQVVSFVDDGVCPLVGLCAVLYPLAGAAWGKSKTCERASVYAGSVVLVLYAMASLAIAPTFDAGLVLATAIRAIIAAVAAAMLAAVIATLLHAFALIPARKISLAFEHARQQRRADWAMKEGEAQRRHEQIEVDRRAESARCADQQRRVDREAAEACRQAAVRAQEATRYEFQLRYLSARPQLSQRLSQAEFEALLQTTLEPIDAAELDTRKAALSQLLDAFAQEAIAKEPPTSVEQIVTEYRRRHEEIDAASFAGDMKDKMHRWLNKEEAQTVSRFLMTRYE